VIPLSKFYSTMILVLSEELLKNIKLKPKT
jgi:hypothetical protein